MEPEIPTSKEPKVAENLFPLSAGSIIKAEKVKPTIASLTTGTLAEEASALEVENPYLAIMAFSQSQQMLKMGTSQNEIFYYAYGVQFGYRAIKEEAKKRGVRIPKLESSTVEEVYPKLSDLDGSEVASQDTQSLFSEVITPALKSTTTTESKLADFLMKTYKSTSDKRVMSLFNDLYILIELRRSEVLSEEPELKVHLEEYRNSNTKENYNKYREGMLLVIAAFRNYFQAA